jgi:hypothetical protein
MPDASRRSSSIEGRSAVNVRSAETQLNVRNVRPTQVWEPTVTQGEGDVKYIGHCSVVDQQARRVHVAVPDCGFQRFVQVLEIAAAVEEKLDGVGVAALGRGDDRAAVGAGSAPKQHLDHRHVALPRCRLIAWHVRVATSYHFVCVCGSARAVGGSACAVLRVVRASKGYQQGVVGVGVGATVQEHGSELDVVARRRVHQGGLLTWSPS